jgi:heptosyltransferase III
VLVLARGALGDVLLCLPFFAALPDHFQAKTLTLVGTPSIVSLFSSLPFVGGIMDQNVAAWAGLYTVPPMISDDFRSILASHRHAVVFSSRDDDPVAVALMALGFQDVMTAPVRPPDGKKIHLLDHVFCRTGVTPPLERITLPVPGIDKDTAKTHLDNLGVRKPYITLHPGSGSVKKNSPLEHWLSLASRISREMDREPLFICGPAETRIIQRIKNIDHEGKWKVLANPALPVLSAVIASSRAHVGHDSGVSHLAAAVGARTIVLFGSTDPALWAPRGEHVRIVESGQGKDKNRAWPRMNVDRIFSELAELTG